MVIATVWETNRLNTHTHKHRAELESHDTFSLHDSNYAFSVKTEKWIKKAVQRILSDILLKKCIQFTIIALHFHKGLFWL